MATCSIFANPIIDTEEGIEALADAYDRFLEEEAKRGYGAPRYERCRCQRYDRSGTDGSGRLYNVYVKFLNPAA